MRLLTAVTQTVLLVVFIASAVFLAGCTSTGQAAAHGNFFHHPSELDAAEAMYEKSLAYNRRIGDKEGVASDYGNLGNVYLNRGLYDQAEEMYEKALTLNEQLNHQAAAAWNYTNRGRIHCKRGDIDEAQSEWIRARELFGVVDDKPMEQSVEGWLGSLMHPETSGCFKRKSYYRGSYPYALRAPNRG